MRFTSPHGVPGWADREPKPARLIDGTAIAKRVRTEVAHDVNQHLRQAARRPGLATILVGDDPASATYVAAKQKACREVGITPFDYRLPGDATSADVEGLIDRLNADDAISGILCQLPIPAHLDGVSLTGMISPTKDVDGLTPVSVGLLQLGVDALRPCTPAGVMVLLEEAGIALAGAEVVVVGRSNLFGKPMAQLLLAANATVTMAHSRTRDLPTVCRRAEILIVAVGRDRMIKSDWVRSGATVIDVGMNRADGVLRGDVDFETVRHVASAITPVPGGVGPMTIAMLLRNTLTAAGSTRPPAKSCSAGACQ